MAGKIVVMLGYSLFSDTICQGAVPVEHDSDGNWVVYSRKAEALREITEDFLEYQRQFFAGERSFEDAMLVEQTVVKVQLLNDGSIVDDSGRVFPPNIC